MSLDVYLVLEPECECGHKHTRHSECVYEANITHNLNKMADEVGIYKYLWRPDEIGVTHAHQLIEPLTLGLSTLKSDPEKYKAFNPPNGWGSYKDFIPWIEEYLKACREYPNALIRVSR